MFHISFLNNIGRGCFFFLIVSAHWDPFFILSLLPSIYPKVSTGNTGSKNLWPKTLPPCSCFHPSTPHSCDTFQNDVHCNVISFSKYDWPPPKFSLTSQGTLKLNYETMFVIQKYFLFPELVVSYAFVLDFHGRIGHNDILYSVIISMANIDL